MKHISCLLVSLAVLAAGCVSQQVAYKTEAKVAPVEGEPSQYTLELRLYDLADSTQPKTLAAPRLTLVKGQQGEIKLDSGADGIAFTVLVDEQDAVITVTIGTVVKKGGKTVWSGDQTLSLAK
jgi:hypothetical protein